MAGRLSSWAGTYEDNRRPYIVMAPDVYVSFQGSSTVIGCGECKRKVDFNDYITSVSTEASIDSSPGSASISMTIPDNDINQFFVENTLLIIPMMEVEIFAKGYYLVDGTPKYYRIFWGLVTSVSTSWSGGTTTVNISCKDILRWWELSQVVLNPAFLSSMGSSAGGYQLFQNQLAGLNPYAVIIQLARESAGDFSFTTGSMTSYNPQASGPEKAFSSNYFNDIMKYWMVKFNRIWSSLVLYGTTGKAHLSKTFDRNLSPYKISEQILKDEWDERKNYSQETLALQQDVGNTAAFKIDFPRAGSVDFFNTESQSKLTIANTAREQIGFEFYCDTNGDIVFKPPFYNLNVLPNKPVSWVQNFELIEDSLTDSESEVVTHITSSGNAFGGVVDWGLNDDITTPHTGVYDYHLLRRYGWRSHAIQTAWAGNPKRLFYHCLDMLDRINSKRQTGSVTIPMRPELKLGFPIFVEKYDSFFYVNTISHNFSVGSSATTAVTLSARRSKFVAPENIGILKDTGVKRSYTQERVKVTSSKQGQKLDEVNTKPVVVQIPILRAEFPDNTGDSSSASKASKNPRPVVVRNPKTGKLLGYPQVVMVFKTTLSNKDLSKLITELPNNTGAAKQTTQKKGPSAPNTPNINKASAEMLSLLIAQNENEIIARLRTNRYDAAATSAGVYDYAYDESNYIKQLTIVPLDAFVTNAKDTQPPKPEDVQAAQDAENKRSEELNRLNAELAKATKESTKISNAWKRIVSDLTSEQQQALNNPVTTGQVEAVVLNAINAQNAVISSNENVKKIQSKINALKNSSSGKKLASGSVIVRPVSDEFGFEVIGHYRYGRGVFFDPKTNTIQKPGPLGASPAGRSGISIPFSATGKYLSTDSTAAPNPISSPAIDFASSFEQMTAEDWATGVVFKGDSVNTNSQPTPGLANSGPTSQQTYDGLTKPEEKNEKIFISADNILSETNAFDILDLKPTMDSIITNAASDCSCGIGRPNWLGILGKKTIDDIINVANNSTRSVDNLSKFPSPFLGDVPQDSAQFQAASIPGTDGTSGPKVLYGNLSTKGFFTALNEYLSDKFRTEYLKNSLREQRYTSVSVPAPPTTDKQAPSGSQPPQSPETVETFSQRFTDRSSLFAAAASGDPTAVKALTKQPIKLFGMLEEAFDKTPVVPKALTPYNPPSFSSLVNPTTFDVSGANQNSNPFDRKYPPE